MNIKEVIERDLKSGKSLNDSLLKNNMRIEDLVLEILKENKELHIKIEESEKSLMKYLQDWMSPF